jgi:predicted PurR-regulated permease PerM
MSLLLAVVVYLLSRMIENYPTTWQVKILLLLLLLVLLLLGFFGGVHIGQQFGSTVR